MAEMVALKTIERDPFFHAREGRVNPIQVSNLIDILKGEGEFPPVIVCRTTRKLVAGWHRYEATMQYAGDEAQILTEFREYNSDEERLADSIKESSDSSLPLNSADKQRLIIRGPDVGLTVEKIAIILSVPVESLRRKVHLAHVGKVDGPLLALKRPQKHLAESVLTEEQAMVVNSSDGRTVAYHADQIMRSMQADLVPFDNPRAKRALVQLREMLIAAPLPEVSTLLEDEEEGKAKKGKAKAA